MCVMGCAFASMKVWSVRERNHHMLWCLIAWVQMQKQVRQMGSSLQMWPSPTWTQASWARSTSSVHIWRQMHRVWQTKCFCQGNGLCLVFCATLVLGVENWLVKEDGSERREETRCKDLSGSREALPGLEMLHGAPRRQGPPQGAAGCAGFRGLILGSPQHKDLHVTHPHKAPSLPASCPSTLKKTSTSQSPNL